MTDQDSNLPAADASAAIAGPVVFISHDGRDSELAEAMAKLLKSVSAGMIKTFRSSDKKGREGIDFGDEWYTRLMTALEATSDVVCLFTERSLDRPWILFEAGVAKGKLDRPVVGVALGVPLARVSTGPFYQFMNMDDSPEDLSKLVYQLARRIPSLELDTDVVRDQVGAFKKAEEAILKKLASGAGKANQEDAEKTQAAKLLEELKSLPGRVAERVVESGDPLRRRRMRRMHPMMFEELMHMSGHPSDPVTILMAASMVREEAPWLYELAAEAYRVIKSGNAPAIRRELERLERFSDFAIRSPYMEEFGFMSKDSYMVVAEFPRMLQMLLGRALDQKTPSKSRRSQTKKASSQ